jgi:hypothetical protein
MKRGRMVDRLAKRQLGFSADAKTIRAWSGTEPSDDQRLDPKNGSKGYSAGFAGIHGNTGPVRVVRKPVRVNQKQNPANPGIGQGGQGSQGEKSARARTRAYGHARENAPESPSCVADELSMDLSLYADHPDHPDQTSVCAARGGQCSFHPTDHPDCWENDPELRRLMAAGDRAILSADALADEAELTIRGEPLP